MRIEELPPSSRREVLHRDRRLRPQDPLRALPRRLAPPSIRKERHDRKHAVPDRRRARNDFDQRKSFARAPRGVDALDDSALSLDRLEPVVDRLAEGLRIGATGGEAFGEEVVGGAEFGTKRAARREVGRLEGGVLGFDSAPSDGVNARVLETRADEGLERVVLLREELLPLPNFDGAVELVHLAEVAVAAVDEMLGENALLVADFAKAVRNEDSGPERNVVASANDHAVAVLPPHRVRSARMVGEGGEDEEGTERSLLVVFVAADDEGSEATSEESAGAPETRTEVGHTSCTCRSPQRERCRCRRVSCREGREGGGPRAGSGSRSTMASIEGVDASELGGVVEKASDDLGDEVDLSRLVEDALLEIESDHHSLRRRRVVGDRKGLLDDEQLARSDVPRRCKRVRGAQRPCREGRGHRSWDLW